MGKGKKKGKRGGDVQDAEQASAPAPKPKKLSKKEQRALEREQAFLDAQNATAAPPPAEEAAPAAATTNNNSGGKRRGKKGKKQQQHVDVDDVDVGVANLSVEDSAEPAEVEEEEEQAPPQAAAGGFGALDDSEDEDEEEEEAPAPKASGFAAFNDDSEEEDEDEEEEEAPAPKASGFAAFNDDSEEEEEEEEEEAPAPKASGFAAFNDDSDDDEEEEEEAPAPKASGFAALNDDSDEEDEELDAKALKKKKKKEKKEKKEKKKKDKKSKKKDKSSGSEDEGDDEDAEEGGKSKKKKKLSNKERRKLKLQEELEATQKMATAKPTSTNFAVSYTAIKQDENWENSKDINIPAFTISAFGKTLFDNAELKIAHGRRYGLVGPNGMGKTTVLKQLANGELKIPPKIDCLYVEQEVTADDTPAVEMVLQADVRRTFLLNREQELNKKMDSGEYSEELQEQLTAVYDELSARGSDTAEARALSILSGLGFTAEMQYAPTKSFSGGWRMRVSIARALFMEPTLLLLDEPTNHLDLNAVIWLDEYLQNWKNTLLVVSHDQEFLDSVCTDIIHLDQQQLYYYRGNYGAFKGQYENTKAQMQRAYDKQVQAIKNAKKSGKSNSKAMAAELKKKHREGGAKKKGRKEAMNTQSSDVSTTKLLQRPKEYQVKFTFPNPTDLSPPIIQVRDVSFNYPNAPRLFKDLNFGIDMDSRITIVGPNGVGKSTLLKLVTQQLVPTEGEVLINRHLRIARYHQHFVDILPMNETPVEFLCREHDIKYQLARNTLGKFGLPGSAHTIKMMNLSGGQKSRVVFASLTFQNPHIIVLDEPTNNLDIESIDALSDAINEFTGGVVLVSHDARLITTTEMVLWVCENETVEEMVGGFDAYRDEILTDLAKQEEEERVKQEARNAARAEERKKKMDAMKAKLAAKAAAAK